jgi:hypothetical protein
VATAAACQSGDEADRDNITLAIEVDDVRRKTRDRTTHPW